ncbi:unnamed protein product [Lactuca virosa]|uniref:Amino acid transporter transmembrane domain-containing protein n=1 Tax=Lactuca virosa TaxID=75947 RepID=A0AAU9MVV7_9ASTR|nr:unnamed protein product [Lactuca virosa]
MDLLFSFLEPTRAHSALLASYFSKVVICPMLRKTVPLMNYVQAVFMIYVIAAIDSSQSVGFTPAQIAADRGHRPVSLILSNAHRAQNASNLVKVTVVVGLWGWTVVTLSIASLLMFIRCSSKDPGYVNMSGGIKNNVDADVCFLSD